MIKKKKYIIYILVIFVLLVGAVKINKQLYSNNNIINKIKGNFLDSINNYEEYITKNYKVYSLPLPDKMSFCNTEVPLKSILVRENLDKELLVNTYWHSSFILEYKRAGRYFPIISRILKENGVPDDFKYLAVIESQLTNVVSPAGAAGYWQFMRNTATQFGLEVNEYVDERYDIEKSTIAACKYLKYAYNIFNDWSLVAASYNMGIAGLSNIIKKQKSQSYYDLYLNSETSRYVYRILAVKLIFENPKNYGFNIREKDIYRPLNVIELDINNTIPNLIDFAIKNNTNYGTLKYLNPWLRSDKLINKLSKNYKIILPNENFNTSSVNIETNK